MQTQEMVQPQTQRKVIVGKDQPQFEQTITVHRKVKLMFSNAKNNIM